METVIAWIERANAAINGVVWGVPMLVLLIATGVYLTVGTGFFQVRRFGYVMKNTLGSVFRDKSARKTDAKGAISQFQALATALAATVGTGNIVGVVTAIAAGGPGAVFWMWVSAFFGMMTKYAEIVLGIYFRHKDANGEWVGGPMYYIEKGLRQKWLAVAFSIFCLFASFGIGSIAQVNGIAGAMQNSFHVPNYVTGAVVCLLTAVIVFGGMKRMVAVTEKFVPFMAILYVGGAVAVIALNAEHLGEAFRSIFAGAFSLRAVGSGAAGYVIVRAMRYGFARGVFSNEAGLGSSVMVHSCSDVKEPVKQGLWGVFEVFFDTIVICSLTALTVLCTGAHNVEGLEGIDVTIYAFQSALGPFGGYLVSVGLVLFAFSTLLGWTVYGGRAAGYLGGKRFTAVYRVVFLATVFLGSVSSVQLVWDLSDTFNGLMALPNLVGVLFLSPLVFRITKNYTRRVFGGEQISPLLSYSQPDAPKRTARVKQETEK